MRISAIPIIAQLLTRKVRWGAGIMARRASHKELNTCRLVRRMMQSTCQKESGNERNPDRSLYPASLKGSSRLCCLDHGNCKGSGRRLSLGFEDAIDPQKAARIYVGGVIADCFVEHVRRSWLTNPQHLHHSFYE